MIKISLVLCLLISTISFAQINEGLNTEERAYLYHVVKKSPILNANIGRYLDYQGPIIKLRNQKTNYDSIELLIINHPEYLVIRKHEIAKSPKGLIAEAANKMALWELNNVLLLKRDDPKKLNHYTNEYNNFENYLLANLPPNALKLKNYIAIPHPKLQNVINPSLSFDEKLTSLNAIRFLTQNDQLIVLRAINSAINKYVQNRAFEIFKALGGQAQSFKNILVAAGDGSSTTGILEEREKDEQGRWNKGLPKAVGLFPYQISLESTGHKKGNLAIEPMRYSKNNFQTIGNNQITNIHTDVWGYNSAKQTTVVFEKNGLSYHLFGSTNTRFLSPDSSFNGGTTYQSIINDLEFNTIRKLNEMVTGKKGFNHWIQYNKKKQNVVKLKLEKKEHEYLELRSAPTKKSTKKQRRKSQNILTGLQESHQLYQRKIIKLEQQKANTLQQVAKYQLKLDKSKKLMGLNWATYTENKGLYTFQDSSTFDALTQEFKFPPKQQIETFQIRLIAIPESPLSKSADEVMLHINIMDAEQNYDARINLELNDVFESDEWRLPTTLFSSSDSVALHVFFESLLTKTIPFNIIARGQGIGKWNGKTTVKDNHPNELLTYPKKDAPYKSKFDSSFVRLRKSELIIHIDREINLEINSFTDPVKSNITIHNPQVLATMEQHGLSKNDILSAYRSAEILRQLKLEINILAGKYLPREEAKIVIDRFNKQWLKTNIGIGPTSIKYSELN
ncbi:MAG: hypothetical protein P8H33_08575 [Crocinitomicaceae bacterium]|nr:hypothetical protein [Crocinitomicaceae bacterium]